MSREREHEIIETLNTVRNQEIMRMMLELLSLRREQHRDKLEKLEDAEVRGRSKECKDLLQLFS